MKDGVNDRMNRYSVIDREGKLRRNRLFFYHLLMEKWLVIG